MSRAGARTEGEERTLTFGLADEIVPKVVPGMVYGLGLAHACRGRCRGGGSGASRRCLHHRGLDPI
jgi:hypothetical protein